MDELKQRRDQRQADKRTAKELAKLTEMYCGLPTDEFRAEIMDILSRGNELAPAEFQKMLRDFVERVNAWYPSAEIIAFPTARN
ncbi:hypothetical protein [Noviherbaspirillum pedocola]|uniref:Uncharacterized protein n=1 Tax=Noviherbaspirillum pedocola TaxID=2801341 RepID=A0A934SZW9_9BURK|nr:hypothetical protein [Noviherbaspirillum pedocola]MBK4736127.1 hypothetical protein [Noviherbaspirillum pedocola]